MQPNCDLYVIFEINENHTVNVPDDFHFGLLIAVSAFYLSIQIILNPENFSGRKKSFQFNYIIIGVLENANINKEKHTASILSDYEYLKGGVYLLRR